MAIKFNKAPTERNQKQGASLLAFGRFKKRQRCEIKRLDNLDNLQQSEASLSFPIPFFLDKIIYKLSLLFILFIDI
jgi:hypothetical protein